jgi:hypothetical protein
LSKGGPTPQCTVEFSIKNSKISTVSSSGMLEALVLGSTTVIGQAVGQDPETGERVVYSQVNLFYIQMFMTLYYC